MLFLDLKLGFSVSDCQRGWNCLLSVRQTILHRRAASLKMPLIIMTTAVFVVVVASSRGGDEGSLQKRKYGIRRGERERESHY